MAPRAHAFDLLHTPSDDQRRHVNRGTPDEVTMYRFTMTNDEERVIRLALEEFIAKRRTATSHNAIDAQKVADRVTARECLYNMRCMVPCEPAVREVFGGE
jgi:dissimilatory sulfite reductase (desulfoviridin) alpha/beta subunit